MNNLVTLIPGKTILRVLTGSHSFGTNLPTSDEDVRGVCIPTIDYFFGIKEFEQYESKVNPETKQDDVVIYGFQKYIKLACKGNLSCLNFLFTRKKDILYCDEWGQRLIDNRNLFLTNNVIESILGYTKSQIHRMKNGSGRSGDRGELTEKYGYDTKFAYHAVLITNIAVELLKSGFYHVYRPDIEQKYLKGIRMGEITYEEVMYKLKENLTVISTLEPISPLPKSVDKEKVNQFCVEFLSDYFRKENIKKNEIETHVCCIEPGCFCCGCK